MRTIEVDGIKFLVRDGKDANGIDDEETVGIGLEPTLLGKGGKVYFDVGAHIGTYTLRASRLYDRVLAIEPLLNNIQILRGAIALNGFTNIDIQEGALASYRGRENMYISVQHNPGVGALESVYGAQFYSPIPVNLYTLDEMAEVYCKPTTVKIDVEGAELMVLRGAEHTLLGETDWYIEVHQRENGSPCVCVICKFMKARGYSIETLPKKKMDSDGQLDPSHHYIHAFRVH